jgi:hypothetical protein
VHPAIKEQLGLKFEPLRVPVDALVGNKIQTPTANECEFGDDVERCGARNSRFPPGMTERKAKASLRQECICSGVHLL